MLRAVIFDFDGVVSDSELLHYKALNQVFIEYGVDVPKEVHWEKYLGYSDLENVIAVSRDYDMNFTEDQIPEIVRKKGEIFDELAAKETTIIDGAPQFIDMLKSNGIRMAVCSGALLSDIEIMLKDSDLAPAFETIVAADHVTKGKPDPEGFLLALSRLNENSNDNILPAQCIVVEDSHWGLEAAAAAGMHPIAVTNTYPASQLEKYAEKITENLSDLTIEDLCGLCF